MLDREEVIVNGQTIACYRTTNDTNGNPRYIVHYLELGLPDYYATKATRRAGLRIYHGRAFGGGFVFQSYNLKDSLTRIMEIINQH